MNIAVVDQDIKSDDLVNTYDKQKLLKWPYTDSVWFN